MLYEPKHKILSIRAKKSESFDWKAQAFARGKTLQGFVVDAIEEYIANHSLSEEQHIAYQARLEQLEREESDKE